MRKLLFVLLCLFSGACFAVPPHSLTLSADLLSRQPRAEATASVHGAKPSKWSGVRLQSLLASIFALPSGEKLRGPRLATAVRLTAADGYQVVFSLGELDETLGHLEVLIADRQDGAPLPAQDGPFRLVVPSDKRGARWVRQLVRIEVLELKE